MENLKIRVNSEAESREVQSILFSVGKTHDDGSKDHYQFCFGKYPHFINCEDEYISASRTGYLSYEEITLPELRAMVNPMKEYLVPDNGGYRVAVQDAGLPIAEDWIAIPEGAECLTKCKDHNGDEWILFWKGDYKFCIGHDKEWFYFESGVSEYLTDWCGLAKVIWQREQDEPFLTPECTLNDQYAETEQARQTIKASWPSIGAGAASSGTNPRENNHYFIDVSDVNEVDFYEIAKRYNVTDPAVQHILKKCLAIGNRGHKDLETDLKDILKTAKRALQINGFGE